MGKVVTCAWREARYAVVSDLLASFPNTLVYMWRQHI